MEKEHGGKSNGQGSTLSIQTVPGEELKVVLDDDAKSKLKAILRELDDRRRKEKEAALNKKKEAEAEERRKKEEELTARKEAEEARRNRPSTQPDPRHRNVPPLTRHPLPAHPGPAASAVPEHKPPPPALVRTRNLHSATRYSSRPTLSLHDQSSSFTPTYSRGRPSDRYNGRSSYYPSSRYSRRRYSQSRSRSYSRSRSRSRSPSPISRKPGQSSRYLGRQSQREVVDAELERNGNEYVMVDESGGGQLGSHVKEEDVRHFFEGFKVDKVRNQLTFPSVPLPTNSNVAAHFPTTGSPRPPWMVRDLPDAGFRTKSENSVECRHSYLGPHIRYAECSHTSVIMDTVSAYFWTFCSRSLQAVAGGRHSRRG